MSNTMIPGIVREVCVGNFRDALRAQEMGADRIELCENLHEGGTTPSFGTLMVCKKNLRIPVFAMIRPRGGSFVYSAQEIEIMKTDISICHELGVDGIVLGVLTEDHSVDLEKLYQLLEIARPLPVTFHKAIDASWNVVYELGRLRDAGVSRVLTSGGAPTALEGVEVLKSMIEEAGKYLTIVAAGNIKADNLSLIHELLGAREYHGREILG